MEILKVTQEFTRKEAFRIAVSASRLSIIISCILFAVSAVITIIAFIAKEYLRMNSVWVFYIAAVVMLGTFIYVLMLLSYAALAVLFAHINDPLKFGAQTVAADGERLTIVYKNGVKDVYTLEKLAHYAETKNFVVYKPDRHHTVPIRKSGETAEGLIALTKAIRLRKFFEYKKGIADDGRPL